MGFTKTSGHPHSSSPTPSTQNITNHLPHIQKKRIPTYPESLNIYVHLTPPSQNIWPHTQTHSQQSPAHGHKLSLPNPTHP